MSRLDIVLCTLNARYTHASFGLRYLRANLGPLRERSALLELDLQERPVDAVEAILAHRPRVVGLGVYIWNVALATEVVALLKQLRPDVCVVLGGPEVSHELEGQRLVGLADYVIAGEGDVAFSQLCGAVLEGRAPAERVLRPPLPDLATLALPYGEYTDEDLAHRAVYVEASRGCPYRCEFCLSSLDEKVRPIPLERLLPELDRLLARGARQLKFVDRTFNLDVEASAAILRFFLERLEAGACPGLFLHFEMIPERLPTALRELLARFPPQSLQLELGFQTLDAEVARRIQRAQNLARARENVRFLREQTHAHLHADLIIGLPGEGLDSFGAGFDQLFSWRPHEIQVGVLKRLKGTSLGRHDGAFGMRYSPSPPYEVLETRELDFPTVQRLKRFARVWDLYANSGRFPRSLPLLWQGQPSVFRASLAFSDWLHETTHARHGLSLSRQFQLLADYLRSRGVDEDALREQLRQDYAREGRSDVPGWLAEAGRRAPSRASAGAVTGNATPGRGAPPRQRRFDER